MKKFLFLLAAVALCSQGINAKVITPAQAEAIAKQQFAKPAKLNASNAKVTLSYEGMNSVGQADYYVFNRDGGQGYVIVAGDDMTDAVLAYSDRGSFNFNQAPEPMQQMLKLYQLSLESMRHYPNLAIKKNPMIKMNPEGVKPMFLNDYGEGPHWHQFGPYNNYFPTYNGEHCYAGCVPIAVAHIMKGLQFPAYGNGSNTFHYMLGNEEKTATANFNHSYKYRNMKNAYTETSTNWQDCAQMIYDVAVALQARFSTSSTNVSYDQIIKAMVAYFDYNPNMQFLQKANYTDANWREMVYTELDEGRPVLYFGYRTIANSGAETHTGHAFVVDGYDSEGRLRIIWGFQPEEYNSWFSFDLLSPRIYGDTPYEHDEYKEGFNADQYAIMGIRPSEEGENGGVVVTGTTYEAEMMPANNVRGSFEVKALSGPWQGTIRWALATRDDAGKYTVATTAQTTQVDLEENGTATIDISGSYYLTEGTKYYVVVWSPYFPNNYDWNWFFNDPVPFTVGNPGPAFILGDVNRDGEVNITDAIDLINYIINDEGDIDLDAANYNQDSEVNITDAIELINFVLNDF